MQATDGNFYGTTAEGGANTSGTVFKITPEGKLITIYSFCSQTNCTDGATPYAGVGCKPPTESSMGQAGLAEPTTVAVLYKITPEGKLTTLYSFCSADELR